jgi:hypothetical protein
MVIGSRLDPETFTHRPDIFCTAKQTDTVSAILTLQAMLLKQLTKLAHVLRVYIAVGTHAPLRSYVVNGEFHRHQTEGFGAFFDGRRLG